MIPGITVVIPTIPPREKLARRAIDSAQTAARELHELYGSDVPVDFVTVLDGKREGAAKTRHRGLTEVMTEFVAFLDDDDVMHPNHLTQLLGATYEFGADFVWSRFQIIKEEHVWESCTDSDFCSESIHQEANGRTQRHLRLRTEVVQGPVFLGEKAFSQWDDNDPCQTTITTLVRTELAQDAGGFLWQDDGSTVDGNRRGEDHDFTLRCRAAGGEFRHVPRVTWDWYHHSANTSGLPVW